MCRLQPNNVGLQSYWVMIMKWSASVDARIALSMPYLDSLTLHPSRGFLRRFVPFWRIRRPPILQTWTLLPLLIGSKMILLAHLILSCRMDSSCGTGTYECQILTLLLHLHHSTPTASHEGVFRTYKRISQAFAWRGLKRVVQHFVAACDVCQRAKHDSTTPAGFLQPFHSLECLGRN